MPAFNLISPRRPKALTYGDRIADTNGTEVVFLTSNAVCVATRSFADDIRFADHPPPGETLAGFVANGGRVWACACTGPRAISADGLVEAAPSRRPPTRRSARRRCRQRGV
jgi:hypothetical protein